MRFVLALCTALFALPTTSASAEIFDHSGFHALLRANVNSHGAVNYKAFGESPEFRVYLDRLAKADISTLSRNAKLAFWINAYNASTIAGVLRKPGLQSVMDAFPASGFFKRADFEIAGRKRSLNDIENDIIRKQFDDPRIHAAVNCGAISCPPLAPFAYSGAKIDSELDRQFKAFARDPSRNAIEPGKGIVKLSRILEWYKADFDKHGGVAAYLAKYLDEPQKSFLATKGRKIDFMEYDWALNGQ